MPGDPLQYLLPGDPVPLNTDRDNAIAAAAKAVRCSGFNKAARKGRRQFAQSGIVLVKNVSGFDLDRFCVVGLGDPIIGPAVNLAEYYNEVTFKGHIPTEAQHLGKFAILQEPCAKGKIVPAVVSGVTPVRLARYDATHECADVFDGDPNQLLADRCGSAQILWANGAVSGGGLHAIVRISNRCDPCGDESSSGSSSSPESSSPDSSSEESTGDDTSQAGGALDSNVICFWMWCPCPDQSSSSSPSEGCASSDSCGGGVPQDSSSDEPSSQGSSSGDDCPQGDICGSGTWGPGYWKKLHCIGDGDCEPSRPCYLGEFYGQVVPTGMCDCQPQGGGGGGDPQESSSDESSSEDSSSSLESSSPDSSSPDSSSPESSSPDSSSPDESSSPGDSSSDESSSDQSSSSEESSSSEDCDYTVTGTLSPDAAGCYTNPGGGSYNGQPYYVDDTNTYYLWWCSDDGGTWTISTTLGDGTNGWGREGGIVGNYDPAGTYTGIATVS